MEMMHEEKYKGKIWEHQQELWIRVSSVYKR